jgi:hypothetical protein
LSEVVIPRRVAALTAAFRVTLVELGEVGVRDPLQHRPGRLPLRAADQRLVGVHLAIPRVHDGLKRVSERRERHRARGVVEVRERDGRGELNPHDALPAPGLPTPATRCPPTRARRYWRG